MTDADLLTGKRILAVDDEKDVLDIIREELKVCIRTPTIWLSSTSWVYGDLNYWKSLRLNTYQR